MAARPIRWYTGFVLELPFIYFLRFSEGSVKCVLSLSTKNQAFYDHVFPKKTKYFEIFSFALEMLTYTVCSPTFSDIAI